MAGWALKASLYTGLLVFTQFEPLLAAAIISGLGNRLVTPSLSARVSTTMSAMHVRHMVPILNVSDLADSFAWFAKLGWTKAWDWSRPGEGASFGAVANGHFEVFLCRDGQGGRGRDGGIGGDGQGIWLQIWVDDLDAVYATCQREAIEVTQPLKDEPWGLREMHVRHPDGHVFRLGQASHTHDHDHDHPHPHE